ncbi:MAG: BlaI/MecI/CopY family transcriptional regulator [Cryomorphaceae bacterium]|nr:MAG: BlaI/MecI/CopY family transcriptional regulator [Cryomorphaceae bacterium]
MRELTKAEEQIMQIVWELEKAFVRDIIAKLPEPKPAYNTVSTIVRILEEKAFLSHQAFGKSHQYYPLISRSKYRDFATRKLLSGYFGGSFENLLSYFAKERDLSLKDIQRILDGINQDENQH